MNNKEDHFCDMSGDEIRVAATNLDDYTEAGKEKSNHPPA